MAAMDPQEAKGWLETLNTIFGPGGAVLAVTNGATAWALKYLHKSHKDERAELLAAIKDSEQKRRDDGVAQFAKIDAFADKLSAAYEEVTKTMTSLRIAFARKGILTDADS